MAAILPLLPALAGGATVGSVLTGVSALAGIASGISSYQQGQAQADRAELQSRAAEVNGRMEAIAVNEQLLKTLSRNNAVAAASGIQSTGSVQRAQEAAQIQASQELSVNRFNTEMQKTALTRKAENIRSGSKVQLAGSLFDTVSSGASAFTKIKGT